MKIVFLVRYGEISLKGQNKNFFINTLVRNIKYALRGIDEIKINKTFGRILIENVDIDDEAQVIKRLKRVSGIVYLSKAFQVDSDLESIKKAALLAMNGKTGVSFKVEARRIDKSFPMISPEIAREVGAHILINSQGLNVDVHNPQVLLSVEVREKSYVYYENVRCLSGLPLGTGGEGLALLSGGIDSPVACFMMGKRGMKVTGVHFHSYPFTSNSAKEKVIKLAGELSEYNMGMELYCISLTEIQQEIIKNCDTSYLTVILRRYMLKLAQLLAEQKGISALITGESLGQVASQTVESISCTDAAVTMPILRPLIAIDKNETIDIAKEIGTFETSILPFEDCCTLFVPKHPQTRPKLEKVLIEEQKLDSNKLIAAAMENIEHYKC